MDLSMMLFDQILCALHESKEWARIGDEDPFIKTQNEKLDAVMEKLKAVLSDDLLAELDDSICYMRAAYVDAAMFFGMRAAQLLHTPPSRAEFSAYTLKMMAQRGATA